MNTPAQRERMISQLLLHEGLRLTPYRCTAGYLTIGVGYNIDARGIAALERVIGRTFDGALTREEAIAVLRHDIDAYERHVRRLMPEYDQLDAIRQRVVLDMAFNLGYRALRFEKAIAALKRRDYLTAARQMRLSKWSSQVGDRAERLEAMMKTGKDYES
jgi:lysozyme